MSPICFIVPPHILKGVVASEHAPEGAKTVCHHTLSTTSHIRHARHEHAQAFAAGAAQHEPTQARGQAPKSGLKRTVYDMEHDDNYQDLPGDKVLIKEGGALIDLKVDPSGDPNECYKGFETTYNFYLKFFKRNSVDGKGLKLIGSVHFGKGYQNAFWDGKQMVFGDGDGVIFNGFTDELDVIGHELTHGVVEHTANLEYQTQSGALNESLADCFGIMIKQWSLNQTAEQANWLIGEGIWAKGVKGEALRSMKAPGTAYDDPKVGKDPQPATMADYQDLPVTEDGDYGGVHINSGIPNHAFYLVATKIGGHSWEGAGPIWYSTLTDKALGRQATFQEFADLTAKHGGEHVDAVVSAWGEVGITVKQDKKEL